MGLWELVLAARSLDRRFVSRSAAFADDAEGDRSGDFAVSGGWATAEVAVFEPVGIALEGEDFGVVDEPVDHRDGDDLIAEDLAPGGEGLVGGDDHGCSLIAGGDQAEREVGGLGVEWDVADFVDDQDGVAAEAGEFFLEPAGALRVAEAGRPIR